MRVTLELNCTKLRAHDFVYWPDINKDIENMVKTCNTCQENSWRNSKDPVIPREIPLFLWSTLEMDFFMPMVLDVTSHSPVMRILNRETSNSILNTLQGVYCNFGLPKKILSDNGHFFRAEQFFDFHEKLGIMVQKSSLYNHQSVGSVERKVQTVKQIMTWNPENAWLAMIIFKATYIPSINKSTGELLNSRKYQTNLAISDWNQN